MTALGVNVNRVYVSATFLDLQACRAEVRKALQRLRLDDVSMESYVAEDARPLDKCLADVAECDLYLGIFAWRYGYVPPGQDESITESEYREAVARGKPCLIFLLGQDAAWPVSMVDRDANRERIDKLRLELSQQHTCDIFVDASDLAIKVSTAVAMWQSNGRVEARGTLSAQALTNYYTRLRQLYGRLDLDVLTPPQQEEFLRIQLAGTFVEQSVRDDSPPIELPRELWHRMQADGDIQASEVPDGLDLSQLVQLREAYQAKPLRRLLEVVSAPHRRLLVLLGDPGSGKSTAARYVALALAGTPPDDRLALLAGYVPLLIELRSFMAMSVEGHGQTFLDYLDHRASTDGVGLERSLLEPYLAGGGKAVFIFDGLDEIFEPQRRERAASFIAGFANRYPRARIIVTSRIIGYARHHLTEAGFSHVTLEDLDERQIGDFLTSWYSLALHGRTADAESRRERLLYASRTIPAIRELAGNPLLLTILAIIGMSRDLPRDRWNVYSHAADVLVHRWEVGNLRTWHTDHDFMDEQDKTELLGRLALQMQEGQQGAAGNYIHERDLTQIFVGYLVERYQLDPVSARKAAGAMIQQFRERNFILSRYGPNLYGFVHRAFLEFFCGRIIVDRFKNRQSTMDELTDLFRSRWRDPSWREILRLTASSLHADQQSELVKVLISAAPRQWPTTGFAEPPWHIALAAQCLAEVRTLTAVAEPATALFRELILLLEHCAGIEDKATLEVINDEILPAIRTVGPGIPGADVFVSWYERRGAHSITAPVVNQAACLVGILAADLDQAQRLLSHVAKGPGFRPAMLAGLQEALGRVAARSLVRASPVVDLVRRSRDGVVRQAAARVLGEHIDDETICAVLIDLVQDDSDPAVRQAAVEALGQRIDDAKIRPMIRTWCQPRDGSTVRPAAVRALAQRVDERLVRGYILKLARTDADAAVRQAAVAGLAPRIDDRPVNTLTVARALGDPNWSVRQAATRVLGQRVNLKSTRALLLSIAQNDEHWSVRQTAVRALSERSESVVLKDRARLDEDPHVRHAAIRGLANRRSDREIPPLLVDLVNTEPDRAARYAAIQVLGGYLDQPAIRRTVEDWARGSEDQAVRHAAVFVLGMHADDPSARTLISDQVVECGDVGVRRTGLRALASWTADPAVRALVRDRVVNDPDPAGRITAIHLAGSLLADGVVRAEIERSAREDPDLKVRDTAWRTLTCLPEYGPDLLPTLLTPGQAPAS